MRAPFLARRGSWRGLERGGDATSQLDAAREWAVVSETTVFSLCCESDSCVSIFNSNLVSTMSMCHVIDSQAGGLAGCCLWMTVFPLDVIKNRILSVRRMQRI